MEEEVDRLDGIPGVTPQEFTFFQSVGENAAVRRAYDTMQNQYVLQPKDRIPFADAIAAIGDIHMCLQQSPAWMKYRPPLKVLFSIAERETNARNAERTPQKKRKDRDFER